MLKPLFNNNSELVAWIRPNEHIFNRDMEWVAYLSNGHAWSVKTGNWIGPVHGIVCLDTSGKVIVWNPDGDISGTSKPVRPARAARSARPARPAKPARPSRPARPAQPIGGWSNLSVTQWLNQ